MRRLLLAIDASAPSLAAARTAALLASRLGASLDGLYVEDVNLSRLVQHPDVILIGANRRRVMGSQDVIASALRLQEAAARRGFEEACRRSRLSGAFHVRRGRVGSELSDAAHGFDLLVVGWRGRADGGVCRDLLEKGRRPLLLVRGMPAETLRLAVLKGDAEARALAMVLAENEPVELEAPQQGSSDLLLVLSGPLPEGEFSCSLLLR
ncbi:MAG TPA: universal stress protein [Candidatus Sulfotelmatobacter sp.]|jgi:nucleotide-binding universal stress UspA family protein|nr:universal stress protein [Candidatus Sulfotelmatobacter sp.]